MGECLFIYLRSARRVSVAIKQKQLHCTYKLQRILKTLLSINTYWNHPFIAMKLFVNIEANISPRKLHSNSWWILPHKKLQITHSLHRSFLFICHRFDRAKFLRNSTTLHRNLTYFKRHVKKPKQLAILNLSNIVFPPWIVIGWNWLVRIVLRWFCTVLAGSTDHGL